MEIRFLIDEDSRIFRIRLGYAKLFIPNRKAP